MVQLLDQVDVDGERGEEDHRVDDVFLNQLHPEVDLLEPHDLGRLPDLELTVLVALEQRVGEAEPGQLLPQLRENIVKHEPEDPGQDPEDVGEVGLQLGEEPAPVQEKGDDGDDDADEAVGLEPRVDRVPELFWQRIRQNRIRRRRMSVVRSVEGVLLVRGVALGAGRRRRHQQLTLDQREDDGRIGAAP